MSYDLARFKIAQKTSYPGALAEIRGGRKVGHWAWYVFPQMRGLGKTGTSYRYGISGMGEAEAYLDDEVLRRRLVEISQALLSLDTDDPVAVMGHTDSLKLRSSMTLFSRARNTDRVFADVLDKYYGGMPDRLTIELLEGGDEHAGSVHAS